MADFHFNVHMDGKITFEIHYEEGVLPEAFPEARTRVSRAAKAAVKTAAQKSTEAMKISKVVLSIITILSAVLGLTKVLAFDITNPNCCSD